MVKKEWSVMDYDYTQTYPDVDYSEIVTEPGLVLSMREIYNRYAAQGIDLLKGELVKDDDRDFEMSDYVPDDNLDVMQQAQLLRQNAADRTQNHSARTAKKASKEADKKDSEAKKDERSEAKEKTDEAPES